MITVELNARPRNRGGFFILESPVAKPDNTDAKQALTLFKPGQSGNPKGRPKGSRNKITEAFLEDFFEAWQVFGRPALMATAWTDPAAFVKVAAGLLPKEATVTIDDKRDATDWTRAELVALLNDLGAGDKRASKANGRSREPDSVH